MLRNIDPVFTTLPLGSSLARIYFAGGTHPVHWSQFRHFGPITSSRLDHHEAGANGFPSAQSHSILYAARDVTTCLAEVYQEHRHIDRSFRNPWLVIFDLTKEVRLLDLTGAFVTRIGASTVLHSGRKDRARAWARQLYVAYPDCDGIAYCSSMHGNAFAVAFTDRAERRSILPTLPRYNRALTDASLTERIFVAAEDLGYIVS